jgi:antitoxin (DNA-binding transcriptional repressor) of toxin-antitoxin stability system
MSLEAYLEENHVWHRFFEKQETVHTADASQATGIDLHRITKNLVSVTDSGEHVVLIVPGDRRVNLREAVKTLGVKNVRLMPFDQSEPISGYPPGEPRASDSRRGCGSSSIRSLRASRRSTAEAGAADASSRLGSPTS